MDERINKNRATPTVSTTLPDGSLVELVFDPKESRTHLARYLAGQIEIADAIPTDTGTSLVPILARNNLIRHGVLLLPERADPFPSMEGLVREITEYLSRYVDLSEEFQSIATAYVLLTWVYDAFNELPYLRFRGDYGSGKTRALLVVGSLCYKPFFASGASTVSPVFHTLDTFGGTLIVDESDFRMSDEKAELVKIFNNGNVRGFPVLRSAATPQHTFDPRAFSVFGPKIVAMRHGFDDQALESRFLTEDMGKRALRPEIPLNLPDVQREEARTLRNKLLWYRFTHLGRIAIDATAYDARLSPRLNQIMAPLLAVATDDTLRTAIRRGAGAMEAALEMSRASSPEAQVLEVILALKSEGEHEYLTIGDITNTFVAQFGKEYDRPITPRYVGHLVRNRLRLFTYKRHGSFVLPMTQEEHLRLLGERYGVPSSASKSFCE